MILGCEQLKMPPKHNTSLFQHSPRHAMGTARTAPVANGRFATFKRRLVSAAQAEIDGIEWALWVEGNNDPEPVASFRAPLVPGADDVANTFSLLKGWLVDDLAPDAMREAVETLANSHCRG